MTAVEETVAHVESPVMLIDPRYRWEHIACGDWDGFFIGEREAAEEALALLPGGKAVPSATDLDPLAEVEGFFGLMAESPSAVFAAVDKTRSYPVYFTSGKDFSVSNSARALRTQKRLKDPDPVSLLEMALAGYVTGSQTIFAGLHQLQAGECLIWTKAESNLRNLRYYTYCPRPDNRLREGQLIEVLAEATNAVCMRTLNLAGNRPIWIPLSGGLDSRLMLCKLVELGCDRIQTFSYGPAHNFEAHIAKQVANRLGVPWFFFPCRRAETRQWFNSNERRQYWDFSDGLCVIPFMQDVAVIGELLASGRMPADAIIVNGQSGDFISGGHVPESLITKNPGVEDVFDAIFRKHLALWPALQTPENRSLLSDKITRVLGCTGQEKLEAAVQYELWEWQERQCKYVIGGQRDYDFHGVTWDLPLWRGPYLEFWTRVPFHLKYKQGLYKAYLKAYDYRGLFRDFNPTVWRWPGPLMAVPVAAQFVGLVAGRRAKDRFYKYFEYFGHYSDKYSAYTYAEYLKELGRARSVRSLFVRTWFQENGLDFPLAEDRAKSA